MPGFVLKNGHVVDTLNGIDGLADVYVEDGRVRAIRVHGVGGTGQDDPGPTVTSVDRVIDVSGCIVSAGLVDCHTHVYQHATPLGVDVDRTCLARGVTAVVDAGSSGSSTFQGLKHLIASRCKTKLFAFLHIAKPGMAAVMCSGLVPGGECDSLNAVSVEECHDAIQRNKDVIVGVKVRLATSISDEGRNEQEVFRRSLEASAKSQVPLMVHHALTGVKHQQEGDVLGCPGSLRPGDIYTHCFHGHQANVLDPDTGRVSPTVWEARNRGVLFDVGHGQGSFSWRVAEQCVSEGFWPDTVSTDLHTDSQDGPAYDLLTVMTKMMHLGMSLTDVISAVTFRPAAAIGKLDNIGHLGIGMPADITVLRVEDVDPPIQLEDSFGDCRSIRRSLELVAVFLDGQQLPVFTLRPWPNPRIAKECLERRSRYRVDVPTQKQ